MNRKYEFIETTKVQPVKNKENYTTLYNNNNLELIDETAKLNASESYSYKPVYAAGTDFYSGFFVDRSAIRRPDQMPAGETWMYFTLSFSDSTEMIDMKDTLLECLNDPNKLRQYTQVLLQDAQIYNSIIELDLYQQHGAWTFWYKTN